MSKLKKTGFSLLVVSMSMLFVSGFSFDEEVSSQERYRTLHSVPSEPLKYATPIESSLLPHEKHQLVVQKAEQLKQAEKEAQEAEWAAAKKKAADEKRAREEKERARLAAIEAENKKKAEALIQKEKEAKAALEKSKIEEAEEKSVEVEKVEPVKESVPEPVKAEPVEEKSGQKQVTVQASAYSTNQPELGHLTFTGINLLETPNVIAVDPSFIPLGSTVLIPGYGTFIAGDTGSAIIGNRIDIHMTNLQAALNFGRKTLTITILD